MANTGGGGPKSASRQAGRQGKISTQASQCQTHRTGISEVGDRHAALLEAQGPEERLELVVLLHEWQSECCGNARPRRGGHWPPAPAPQRSNNTTHLRQELLAILVRQLLHGTVKRRRGLSSRRPLPKGSAGKEENHHRGLHLSEFARASKVKTQHCGYVFPYNSAVTACMT
jgi:hypothetical protein